MRDTKGGEDQKHCTNCVRSAPHAFPFLACSFLFATAFNEFGNRPLAFLTQAAVAVCNKLAPGIFCHTRNSN